MKKIFLIFKNIVNKRALICKIWLIIFCFGWLPVNYCFNVDFREWNILKVDYQVFGCPAPNALIIDGNIDIPWEYFEDNPNINYNEINLSGINSPFEVNEFFYHDLQYYHFIVQGYVEGVDTILCDPDNCETAPRFYVEKWGLETYFPLWLTLNNFNMILYLLFTVFGIILFLIWMAIIGIKKVKSILI